MIRRAIAGLLLAALAIAWASTAAADKIKKRDTIASLERRTVEVRPGSIILNSTDCVIVKIVIESLDIGRKLLRFSGFELEITKPTHRLGA